MNEWGEFLFPKTLSIKAIESLLWLVFYYILVFIGYLFLRRWMNEDERMDKKNSRNPLHKQGRQKTNRANFEDIKRVH